MQKLYEQSDNFPRTPLLEHMAAQSPCSLEAPIDQEIKASSLEEARLIEKLNSMSHEELARRVSELVD